MGEMKKISISESKSMAIRVLTIASFIDLPLPAFKTLSKDVREYRDALVNLRNGGRRFQISDGAAPLRFLLARLSRENGSFTINTSSRLLKRPHDELIKILTLLGAKIETDTHSNTISIYSSGWLNCRKKLTIDCKISTQYISAIALSSWNLSSTFSFNIQNLESGLPYWLMTRELLLYAGMQLELSNSSLLTIMAHQKPSIVPESEPDMSTAFSLAAVFILKNGVIFESFPKKSLQADYKFIDILKDMGVSILWDDHNLIINPNQNLKPISVNLFHTPDLLPVLSSLCSLANGKSALYSIYNTQYKESDRVQKSIELIKLIGGKTAFDGKNLEIESIKDQKILERSISFNPDQDHRMAMAAAVLKAKGFPITILTPGVVEKSYPEFWDITGISP